MSVRAYLSPVAREGKGENMKKYFDIWIKPENDKLGEMLGIKTIHVTYEPSIYKLTKIRADYYDGWELYIPDTEQSKRKPF